MAQAGKTDDLTILPRVTPSMLREVSSFRALHRKQQHEAAASTIILAGAGSVLGEAQSRCFNMLLVLNSDEVRVRISCRLKPG
jgi:hypothetical protein